MSSATYPTMKRLFDVAVSALALVCLSPILAIVAIAVRATMGSPVVFRQDRPGLGGKVFQIYKFRTMLDGEGTDEERLTKAGALLRSTSLDELPELWNVVRGDMSLVGPRPLHVHYLSLYSERQSHRHDVLPGITGLAQVRGRNSLSWEERFELDLEYVERASFSLDLKILAETALTVVRREGISEAETATMTPFEGTPSTDLPETAQAQGASSTIRRTA